MKIVAIGQNDLTRHCLDGFMEAGWTVKAIIGSMDKRADSIDIGRYATEIGAEMFWLPRGNSINDATRAIRHMHPDYLFVSWHEILKPELLSIPKHFTIGTHPTPLPLGSGRHPLHWLLALGYIESALSFFRMTVNVDAGPLLIQESFPVGPNISETQKAMHLVGQRAARRLGQQLNENATHPGLVQDDSNRTTWRARIEADITIDPRMSVDAIVRLVNSYGPPFPGAILKANQARMRVVEAKATSIAGVWEQTGTIMEQGPHTLLMKADDGVVYLRGDVPQAFRKLTYIRPPASEL